MLAEKFKNIEIILASQSPRRQELLKGLDLTFRIETRPVEELYSHKLTGHEITDYLAKLKADAFHDLRENQLLITSDTIVWMDGRALEKPTSAEHAAEMLSTMSGAQHQVFTSVCFTSTKHQETIHDMTRVYFGDLSSDEIQYYIQQYKPFDKAGAYGVQDWLGYTSVERLEGCYYNVMGLPLPKVYHYLKNYQI
ncbi:Maf family nucleotide pyrophosphatase [Nonlabens xiamenensis]|uniref:Maf family nucleotide pyrophosphatase n=1 Tax=Nonlabens xiamenensis TaxID=2341043 RepID=UPI000F60F4C6|nr:Maf family nucleotide pyrophosphatase [Nonlabens xiamenensis]